MDFQAGVRARLIADAGVRAIVAKRVTWLLRPQGSALPAITLQTVFDGRPQHLKGNDGARSTLIMVDCWAATFDQALALARAVIAALTVPATVADKKFGASLVEAQRDQLEDQDGTPLFRQSIDFSMWHVGD